MTRSRPPRKCVTCGDAAVAWTKPRVDFCYQCLPGGPLIPPPCSRCGSDRYFNNGLCDTCHPGAPQHPGSCEGCLAWGVYRKYRWRCWKCRWWHTHYIKADCNYCGRFATICELRACRLCWEEACRYQLPGRNPDLAFATRFGQQLFLADFAGPKPKPHRHLEPATPPKLSRLPAIEHRQDFTPVPWQQQRLFDITPIPQQVIEKAAAITDSALLKYCDEIIASHAAVHGWSTKQTNDVRRSVRLLHATQDTPGARINATDVLKLPKSHSNVSAISTIDVLAAAGLLIDDRTSTTDRHFTRQIAGLPAPMTAQLRIWFEVMINGSTIAPRRRPRDPKTAKLHIRALAPMLRIWAAQGHDSLAEIKSSDIIAALPAPGPRRHHADQGLRSVFGILKARKQIFINPTHGVPHTLTNTNIPLPLDTNAIRAALDSPDPAAALAVALVAFHALTSRQIRGLTSRPFPWKQVNLAPQTLREDRILHEIRATNGDIRRVCELFGLSVEGALRYAATLDHTDSDTTGS